jgi:hypothetical protein
MLLARGDSTPKLWERFQEYLCRVPCVGLTFDVSRMNFSDALGNDFSGP